MLTKITINGVTITSTYAHKDEHVQDVDTTNLHIDSLSFEDEATAEEMITLLKSVADVFKTVRPAKKNTPAKRFHVCKYYIDYGRYDGKKYYNYYIVQEKSTKKIWIKFIFENGTTYTKELEDFKLDVYNKKKYVVAEYDCNNFKF